MEVPAAREPVSVPFVLLAVFVLLLVSAGPASASGPDGRVRGFVTDSVSGSPVPGAFVRIEASDLPWAFEGSSDGSGYFQIAVPPHRYTMSVSESAHLLSTTAIAVGSAQTVWSNVTLSPASSRSARLQGYVTDFVTFAPVTVGRIVAGPWVGSFSSYQNASALNASGYYAMNLVPSSYDVHTDGVIGYAAYDYYPVYIGTGEVLWYNLSLNPNPVDSWINGTVYDQVTSSPIAGANITARVDGLLYLPSVSSNATGRYSMPVPSGNVEIAADALGHAPSSASVYVWSGGGQYALDFALTPFSKTVRGYLTDGVTHAPLPGVLVTVAPLFFTGYYDQATTNASGGYQLSVPDDYYVVSARQTGYTPWSAYIINFAGSTAWANGTLWPIVSRISGYLTDAVDGSPVPGLVVSAIDLRTSYQAVTTADAAGFFSVAVPPSPAMSVWAYGNANYAGNVSYVETRPYVTTWANMTIDRLSAAIVANVTNAVTGQPIAGVSVIAAWFTGTSFGTTNATGIAIVNAPTTVDVYVTAIASGYEYWTGILHPVAGTNPLSISLWPILPYDVHIRGYVRDPNSGTGVSYVAVEAAWDTGSTATAYTNGTGYYDLSTVAAPQTVQARETGFAGSQASVSPASGDVLWVNLTLAADSSPPVVRSFTATPSTGLDPAHPAALLANVSEARLDNAFLSIHMMYSSLAGVGSFLNLGYRDPSTISIANPSNGTFTVSSSWDTQTPVARLTDLLHSTWWPVLTISPFLAAVNGYYDDASLTSPTVGNAVFDTRDGRLLFVITTSGYIGPHDDLTSTFEPAAYGFRIDLTSAAILGYALISGPTFALGSLHLALASAVPSGTYAGVLELRDAAGQYTQAAVLMQTVADTTPPVASAGADFTVNEDAAMAFNGTGSTDNVEIVNYTWTFVDGGPRSLFGPDPSFVFATPGTYVVTLTVRDAAGNAATDTVAVTVRDVTNPALTLSSPAEGLIYSGSLVITANATDNVGVVRVKLFVDSVSIQDDFAAPYEFVLAAGSLSVGNHTIQVIAYDAAGNSASQIRHVTVVAGSGGGLLPNVVVFGGLILLVLAGVAGLALVLLRRKRPRPPAMVPSPPPSTEVAQRTTAPLEEPPTEPAAPEPTPPTEPDPDFDLPLQ